MDTQILKHGIPARLFPVCSEAAKEQRTLSIVLATMISVRPFAERLLTALNVRTGKRSRISAFTEVTLTNEIANLKDRPDALLVVEQGKKSWSALVEAKIGKNSVGTDQLERYIDLAKANGVDAIITVSNDLTVDPSVNPTPYRRNLPKGLSIFHLSWSAILTEAFLLVSSKTDPFENDDEAFLISELVRYLEDFGSGRLPLDQMSRDWPKIVGDVQTGHPLNPKSAEMLEMMSVWNQEARDVALLMTRKLGEPVRSVVARKGKDDNTAWTISEVKKFCEEYKLGFELDIPNAASRLYVEADFRRRLLRAFMVLSAPTDRKSNSAKLNWVLKQIEKGHMAKVAVTCKTKGKGQNFGAMAHEIDVSGDEIRLLADISSFQIEMSVDLGKNFNSRKKFVEALERHVPYFYGTVGERLKAFVPPAPKMSPVEEAKMQSNGELDSSDAPQVSMGAMRPNWASQWQAAPSNSIAIDPVSKIASNDS